MHKTRCSGLVHWFDSEKWGWEGDGKGVQGKKGKNKTKKNLNIQKTMIMASGPITSGQINGKTVTDFIFLGSKITADFVATAMKLKDTCFLEEKL